MAAPPGWNANCVAIRITFHSGRASRMIAGRRCSRLIDQMCQSVDSQAADQQPFLAVRGQLSGPVGQSAIPEFLLLALDAGVDLETQVAVVASAAPPVLILDDLDRPG